MQCAQNVRNALYLRNAGNVPERMRHLDRKDLEAARAYSLARQIGRSFS